MRPTPMRRLHPHFLPNRPFSTLGNPPDTATMLGERPDYVGCEKPIGLMAPLAPTAQTDPHTRHSYP